MGIYFGAVIGWKGREIRDQRSCLARRWQQARDPLFLPIDQTQTAETTLDVLIKAGICIRLQYKNAFAVSLWSTESPGNEVKFATIYSQTKPRPRQL